jgi:hypothetical protein
MADHSHTRQKMYLHEEKEIIGQHSSFAIEIIEGRVRWVA